MIWDAYLVDAAGFFFQFYPCVLLCFLPFDGDKLAVKKRRIYLAMTVLTLAMSVLFPLVTFMALDETKPIFHLFSNTYALAAIVVIVAVYACLVREHLYKKLLVVYAVIYYAVLLYWLSNLVHTLPHPSWYPELNTTYCVVHVLFYALSVFTIFPLAALFMRRGVTAFLREIDPGQVRREFFYATLSSIGFLALLFLLDLAGAYTGNAYIYLFLMFNQAMVYWLVFTGAVSRSREENARRVMDAQKLQYDRISADMERASRLRHDMRHHWNYLYSLTASGGVEQVRRYLSALAEQTEHRETEAFCENSTVNALLQYYIGRARDEGIACTVAAQCGDLAVSPEDLSVIIGNVLENAVSACQRAGGGSLDVKVGVLHGAFALEVINTCSGVRLARGYENTGDFLPAAAFLSVRDGGGRGIASVSDLAQKYLGSAAFRYDGEKRLFTTQVILNQV